MKLFGTGRYSPMLSNHLELSVKSEKGRSTEGFQRKFSRDLKINAWLCKPQRVRDHGGVDFTLSHQWILRNKLQLRGTSQFKQDSNKLNSPAAFQERWRGTLV